MNVVIRVDPTELGNLRSRHSASSLATGRHSVFQPRRFRPRDLQL